MTYFHDFFAMMLYVITMFFFMFAID